MGIQWIIPLHCHRSVLDVTEQLDFTAQASEFGHLGKIMWGCIGLAGKFELPEGVHI